MRSKNRGALFLGTMPIFVLEKDRETVGFGGLGYIIYIGRMRMSGGLWWGILVDSHGGVLFCSVLRGGERKRG